jgi:hypothetical protein
MGRRLFAGPFAGLFAGLFARIAAVVSGLLVTSFIAFPSFPSTGFLAFTSAVWVDRTLKSDRLPLDPPTDKTEMPVREKIPIGCDRAFSPISAPRLANVFRRCAV